MTESDPTDKRIQPRHALRLRADARLLQEDERAGILAGNGFPELDSEGLSLSKPRRGLVKGETRDLSSSGLRLSLGSLGSVEAGAALCLDLHLPGDRRVIRLLGDVIWQADQGGEPIAGLRIAALELEGLQRLLQRLDPPSHA